MDIAFHIAVPLLLLMAAGAKKKHALALLPLAILPDIGRFFYMAKGLHSVIFILAAVGLLYAVNYVARAGKDGKTLAAIGAFYLFSHLLLDLGAHMALFYPFSHTTYALQARIILVNLMPTIVIGLETGLLSEMEQGMGGVLNEAGIGLLVMACAFILYKKMVKKNG